MGGKGQHRTSACSGFLKGDFFLMIKKAHGMPLAHLCASLCTCVCEGGTGGWMCVDFFF